MKLSKRNPVLADDILRPLLDAHSKDPGTDCPGFGSAPVRCSGCGLCSAPPYTKWEKWNQQRVEPTLVGSPGYVVEIAPGKGLGTGVVDGRHSVIIDLEHNFVIEELWFPGDPTPKDNGFLSKVGLSVSDPRLLCGCNIKGSASSGAGAGAGRGRW